MKRILCIVLALLMVSATALVLGGCGDDKSKSSSKTEATKAPTIAATTAPTTPTAAKNTLATVQPQTDNDDETDATEEQPTDQDPSDAEYYGEYGGLSGQEAILRALDYSGSGYQCVSYDKQFLQGQEAWYVGIQATQGNDDTVYYLYVNADQIVPETEIPAIDDNGNGNDLYAGITEQEAINTVLDMYGDGYICVSSEEAGAGATEYWRIGVQDNAGEEAVVYYWVNDTECFAE